MNIRYSTWFANDSRPTTIAPSQKVVPAGLYGHLDQGYGGITRQEIHDVDITTCDALGEGADVFVESSDPTDCTDDSTEKDEVFTHIWWRATIVPAANPMDLSVLAVRTTANEVFSGEESAKLAHLILKRFGNDLPLACAKWRALLGNGCTDEQFRRLAEAGANLG